MLTLYRRHLNTGFGPEKLEPCPNTQRDMKRGDSCPVWVEGVDPFGTYHRKSLRTTSWDIADRLMRQMLLPPEPKAEDSTLEPELMSFERARALFLSNMEGEGRERDTIRKYKLLFTRFEDFAVRNHLAHLQDFTFENLVAFRREWKPKDSKKSKEGVNTRNKMLDRMKAVFAQWHRQGFIPKNPAADIKPEKAPTVKVQPFSAEEQGMILAKAHTTRYRAFVHVLYHSGLRISDCCFLRPADFKQNNICRINRKNQVEIYVPIPPYLKAQLDQLPLCGGYYFLIGESENLHTQTDAWRTILNDLFKTDIPGFHPHRFRHTRVVEWLAAGLTLEEISGMIGTSVKVLEKHYASFAPTRQRVVADKLNQLWAAKPELVRMK